MEKGENNYFHLSQCFYFFACYKWEKKKNIYRGCSRKSYFPFNSVLEERKIKRLSMLLRKKT